MSNDIALTEKKDLDVAESLGIEINIFRALRYSLFPDLKIPDWSFGLYLAACKAKNYDPLKKPYHIVMMNRNIQTKKGSEPIWESYPVIMPSIMSYRTDGIRTNTFMGMSLAKYGDIKTEKFLDVTVEYPEWCEMELYKLAPNGQTITIPARLYWKECYATQNSKTSVPNDMWKKRTRAQLEKCTEALCWRKGYPEEMGNIPTYEEMEGRNSIDELPGEKEINPLEKKLESGTPLSQTYSVDENELLKYIDKIKNSTELDLLQIAYKNAKAFVNGDKSASNEISKATRARKSELEASKKKKDEPVTETQSNSEWMKGYDGETQKENIA
jgi:phage recombination protein Bet